MSASAVRLGRPPRSGATAAPRRERRPLAYGFALYGAHLFRYFLVEARAQPSGPAQYRIVFAEAGDRLAIYSRAGHGLYDIEPTTCTAGEC